MLRDGRFLNLEAGRTSPGCLWRTGVGPQHEQEQKWQHVNEPESHGRAA